MTRRVATARRSSGLAIAGALLLTGPCTAPRPRGDEAGTARVVLSDTVIAVDTGGVVLRVPAGVGAAGPMLELRVKLPRESPCDLATSRVLTAAGPVSLRATARTVDGARHELGSVWAAGSPCRDLVLEAQVFVDSLRALEAIELASDGPSG